MAKVVRDKKMEVPAKALYEAVTDFGSYPKFLSEVVSANEEPRNGAGQKVTFELEIVKRFSYTLEFKFAGEEEVSWKLVQSNFFKANEGKWVIRPLSEKETEVHYELDVDFGFFVPGWVSKKLTEVNLPRMFDSYEKRAREIAGGMK